MRVEAVSAPIGGFYLDAVVVDDGGVRRQIHYSWREKNPTGVPHPSWLLAIQGECEYQRSQELAREKGRLLP